MSTPLQAVARGGISMSSQVTNYSMIEDSANTLKMGKKEINGSSGARMVLVYGWALDVGEPDAEASQKNTCEGFIGVGDLEHLTTFGITTDGGLDYVKEVLQCDATPYPVMYDTKAPVKAFFNLREQYIPVPKSGDGKFYFTVGIKGTGNANAKYVYAKVFAIVLR